MSKDKETRIFGSLNDDSIAKADSIRRQIEDQVNETIDSLVGNGCSYLGFFIPPDDGNRYSASFSRVRDGEMKAMVYSLGMMCYTSVMQNEGQMCNGSPWYSSLKEGDIKRKVPFMASEYKLDMEGYVEQLVSICFSPDSINVDRARKAGAADLAELDGIMRVLVASISEGMTRMYRDPKYVNAVNILVNDKCDSTCPCPACDARRYADQSQGKYEWIPSVLTFLGQMCSSTMMNVATCDDRLVPSNLCTLWDWSQDLLDVANVAFKSMCLAYLGEPFREVLIACIESMEGSGGGGQWLSRLVELAVMDESQIRDAFESLYPSKEIAQTASQLLLAAKGGQLP